jgi:hypothetical protein
VTRSWCGFARPGSSSFSGPTFRRSWISRTALLGGSPRSASFATRTSYSRQHRALRMARFVGPGPLTRRAAPGPLRSQLPFEGPSSASYASGRGSGRPTCFRHHSIRHAIDYGLAPECLLRAERLAGLPQAEGRCLASISPAVGHRAQAPPAHRRGRSRRMEDHADAAQVLPAAGRGDYA